MKTLNIEKLQNHIENKINDINYYFEDQENLKFCKKYLTKKLESVKDSLQEIIISIEHNSTFIFKDFNKIIEIRKELESGWYDCDFEEEKILFNKVLEIFKTNLFENIICSLIDLKEKEVLDIKLDQIDFMKGIIKNENE